jgi:hypothetical protein
MFLSQIEINLQQNMNSVEPYTIIEQKGTKIVAENQKHIVTRNAPTLQKDKRCEWVIQMMKKITGHEHPRE